MFNLPQTLNRERVKPQEIFLKFASLIFFSFLFFGITAKAYAAVSVSIFPTSTSTLSNATTTFMATVMNASNTTVTWSANFGIISSSGVYTAPSVLGTSTILDTITATSIQDNTKSATATVAVSSGLAAYWNLDEGSGTTAYDISGSGNNGTWSGTTPYYTTGKVGNYAGNFNGGDVLTASSVSPSNISVSFWIRDPSPNLDYNGIIDAGKNQTPSDWYFIDSNTGCGNGQGLIFGASAGGAEICYSWGDSAWHMITGVYSVASGTQSLYVDGVLKNSEVTTRKTPQSYPLKIGQYFTGSLDDIRIYSRPLSAAEIEGLYVAQSGATDSSAPIGVSATPESGEALVSFNPPNSNGGTPITLYTITSSPGNIVATTTIATSTLISGLTNGISYTFTVTATNWVGTSSSSLPSNSVTPSTGAITVNWNTVDQVIDGFGASSAFEAAPLTQSQANLFFSTSTGVGLSLLRTEVPNDGSCSTVNSTCAGEVSDMQMASALGARVWSTPWSPPASMTTNSSTDCTVSPSPSHLATSSYASYATYLSNYISSVESEGVPLYALSVQNEPNYCANYGGAIWSDQNFDSFIKNNLGPTLVTNNQTSTKIMLPESSNWTDFDGLADTTMNDPSASTYVGILAFHGYDNATSISNPYASSGKSFWETEVSAFSAVTQYAPSLSLCNGCWDPSMADGLLWAQIMNYNLTGANVNAWNYWWLISYNDSGDNEGLINGSGAVSKRLYVMGNYSKFVRPGWYRVDATVNPTLGSGIYVSAFRNLTTGDFAIVAINTNASDTSTSIDVNGITAANSVTPWVTSTNLNLVQQTPIPVVNDVFNPTLAAQSVTTFVGTEVPAPPTPTVEVAAGYAPTQSVVANPITSMLIPSSTTQGSSSTSSLQAELNILMTQLASLEAQAGTARPNASSSSSVFAPDLSYGMTGVDVTQLQTYLIEENKGPASAKLKIHGTTQYFGILTYNALVEFQKAVGITPASGFFGPITRAYVAAH